MAQICQLGLRDGPEIRIVAPMPMPLPLTLTSLSHLAEARFDEVIDVRSPAEYAQDHIPGAVNLPVLDNAQRAEVGRIYVQECKFTARKIGAAHVTRNAARHLETALKDKPGGYRPLVYCWRGGQRSGFFASLLAQIGWRAQVVEGGYRSYRRLVAHALYEAATPAPVVLIDGDTGVGKTEILGRLAKLGAQVIDLEDLAQHRGSVFGARAGGQPSQKAFEGRLAAAMAALNPSRPVAIEAESNAIGQINLPPSLWRAMRAAPRVELSAPLADRARRIVADYQDLIRHPALLIERIERLRPLHAAERITGWIQQARAGDFEALFADLIAQHYDPRYARQRLKQSVRPAKSLALDDLSTPSLDAAAEAIAAWMDGQGTGAG